MGFLLASVIQVTLNNGSGSCSFKTLGFLTLPQNRFDNLLMNFLELKTSSGRMSSYTKAEHSVAVHIQLPDHL